MARRVNANDRGTTLKLGDRSFQIVYDMNALDLFMEISGVNLLHDWPADKFTPRAVVNFVYAGMLRFHEQEFEEKDVKGSVTLYKWLGQTIDYSNYEGILVEAKKALDKGKPKPKPNAEGAPGNA